MKRLGFGGLAFLVVAILAFWLRTEPRVQQAQDSAVPSQPGVTQSPVPPTSLNGGETIETVDTPTIADQSQPGSNADTAIDRDSVVIDIPIGGLDTVPVLPGIELSGDIQVFHRMLEAEIRDESWAVPMEEELYDYFFEKSPELANNFGVPNVVCRTTICEVQVIGYGQESLETWQAATSDLDSQPWAEAFIQVRLSGNQVGPDAGGLVLIFVRASGDATVQSVSGSEATI